jgi:hypothetical protein
LASFTVQDFGLEGLRKAMPNDVAQRLRAYTEVIS